MYVMILLGLVIFLVATLWAAITDWAGGRLLFIALFLMAVAVTVLVVVIDIERLTNAG
jgi:hypothetical protein